MRAVAAGVAAFLTCLLPAGAGLAQTPDLRQNAPIQLQTQAQTRPVPGVEVPGYPGLFAAGRDTAARLARVLDRARAAGQFDAALNRSQPCARRRLVDDLRAEGIDATPVTARTEFTALASGECGVLVTAGFQPGRDDRQPPDERGRTDDVGRPDRTPPEIRPLRGPYERSGESVTVVARITDDSGSIASAIVRLPDRGPVTMTPGARNENRFSAEVTLPESYGSVRAVIVAEDPSGNRAREEIELRRLAPCGDTDTVSRDLVAEVQRSLACIGLDTGGQDGVLDPPTCRAIERFLEDSSPPFLVGQMGWPEVAARGKQACATYRDVAIEVDSPLRADAARAGVTVRLPRPGGTAAVEVVQGDRRVAGGAYRGGPVGFEIDMPLPGEREDYAVRALDAQDTALAEAALTLIRPPVMIRLAPAGRVERDGDSLSVVVEVVSGRDVVTDVVARLAGEERRADVAGGRAQLVLPMPAPGSEFGVEVAARSAGGSILATEMLLLVRPPGNWWGWVTDNPAVAGLIGLVVLIILALLARWLWPNGGDGGGTPPDPKPRPAAPQVTVRARPDRSPRLSLGPADLPGITMRVVPDATPSIRLMLDEKE